ncbi:MAG: heme exporter protein CcmD [Rheinheimera sp.]|nr:heme exporter protein CcmD [Rheinheimera sp.]
MYFQSMADFWAMGGYGLFVWLSFGITYFLLAGLIAYSHYQQHVLKKQLAAKLAREQRVKQYQEQAQ